MDLCCACACVLGTGGWGNVCVCVCRGGGWVVMGDQPNYTWLIQSNRSGPK